MNKFLELLKYEGSIKDYSLPKPEDIGKSLFIELANNYVLVLDLLPTDFLVYVLDRRDFTDLNLELSYEGLCDLRGVYSKLSSYIDAGDPTKPTENAKSSLNDIYYNILLRNLDNQVKMDQIKTYTGYKEPLVTTQIQQQSIEDISSSTEEEYVPFKDNDLSKFVGTATVISSAPTNSKENENSSNIPKKENSSKTTFILSENSKNKAEHYLQNRLPILIAVLKERYKKNPAMLEILSDAEKSSNKSVHEFLERMGETISYTFVPLGLGISVKVKESITDEEFNISDIDSW